MSQDKDSIRMGEGEKAQSNKEEKKTEYVGMYIRPSHKEIIRREADRRGYSMSDLFIKLSMRALDPQGRRLKTPEEYKEIDNLVHRVARHYEDFEGQELIDLLDEFGRELMTSLGDLKKEAEERAELRTQAQEEGLDEYLSFRVKPSIKERVDQMAEEAGESRSTIWREAFGKGLHVEEVMKEFVKEAAPIGNRVNKFIGTLVGDVTQDEIQEAREVLERDARAISEILSEKVAG